MNTNRQEKPKSIEASLVSLGWLAGTLGVVLLVAIVAVEHSLSRSLQQTQDVIVPAGQAVAGTHHAVARLFERQSQVLSTRTRAELDSQKDRASIDEEFQRSNQALESAFAELNAGTQNKAGLQDSTRALLAGDQLLFESVARRHDFQQQLDETATRNQGELQKLIQEAKAVSGSAHLGYVLALRRLAKSSSSSEVRKLVFGADRVQQEAADRVVNLALQLGQLVGKIALARTGDELNSIASNELSQNLDRARNHLRTLLSALDPADPVHARVTQMQQSFERIAAEVSDAKKPVSLINLRRGVLNEADKSLTLRKELLAVGATFASDVERAQSTVTAETAKSARSARATLWGVRLGMLGVFGAAIWVGIGAVRRMKESVAALRSQNEQLASLGNELQQMNEGLEAKVRERSAALLTRERSLRLVLDSIDEALVMVNLAGRIVGESSKAAQAWFGTPQADSTVWDYVLPAESKLQAQFQMGFEQIADDILPFEATVGCLPQRFEREHEIYSVTFRQVFEDGTFRGVLLAVKKITTQVASELREREAREQQMMLAALLKDKAGFRGFVRDGEELLAELRTQPEREPTLRALHTLKGNTSVYGMESVARYCHLLEEHMAEGAEALTAAELDELTLIWRSRIHKIEEMVTNDAAVELGEIDYSELLLGLRHRKDHEHLVSMVEAWKWSATSAQLQRLSRQVRRVAEKLDKHVQVSVEHHRLRIMPGPLDAFWGSLVHVVRNAVDHGIEAPEERIRLGKPEHGHVILRTLLQEQSLVVELQDDGRGVDFAALAKAAAARGVSATTRDDLILAMFSDGVTTREEATELSGRGVGLAAVAQSCRNAGGRIECITEPGHGACFRFVFPLTRINVREGTPVRTGQSERPALSTRRVG